MPNPYFQFKQFTIHQDQCAMKVTTDGCLFGAWVAREIKGHEHPSRNMFDIGTGTGLLTLMVAQKNPGLTIDGIEIDENAYLQAKENVLNAAFPNKIYLYNEDVLKEISAKKYDVIVSNPPFYEKEISSTNMQKNIAHHSEGLLLDDLLQTIKSRITASSYFYLLMPYKRKKELETLFQKHQLHFEKKVFLRQSVKHDYFRILISGTLQGGAHVEETEISITDESGGYTSAFTNLLKDYYLKL